MSYRPTYTLLIAIVIIVNLNYCYAQKNKNYKKECCKFLKYVRNDMFINLGFHYMPSQNDSIYILEYTTNKNFFLGTNIYGDFATNNLISENEKIAVVKKIINDTTKNKIETDCVENCYLLPEIITKKLSNIIYSFSNPIFVKNYTFCYFSINALIENDGTQDSYLFQKKRGTWKLVKRIGGIQNY